MSMHAPHLGDVDAAGLRAGLVVARFNAHVTERLLAGARDALIAAGMAEEAISVVHVPGALELPTIAARMAELGRFDVIVCLGCVIRGGTAHFDHVCRVAMDGIGRIALRGDVGVGNGVLTVDTEAQALERAGGAHGNKGAEAALTAVSVYRSLQELEA